MGTMLDLARLLGVRYPLVQAPMAGAQGSALAIAVGRAGALGSLPAALLAPDALRSELAALSDAGVPYNVNFFAHTQPEPDAAREAVWRAALAPHHASFGLAVDAAPSGPGRVPFSAEAADVLAEFEPPVVSFHFGLPALDLLQRVQGWGAVVLSTATTLAEARWLAEQGVDVVIAQGLEAGGHRGHFLTGDLDLTGQLPTLDLVRAITAELDVPVLASGGIADAEGVRAALAAGAGGVQVGSALLCAFEATTSLMHRAALQAGGPTALTNVFTGRPARGLVNRAIAEVGDESDGLALSPLAPAFPHAGAAMGPLRAAAEASGSTDWSPLWLGEGAAPRSAPAASIVAELAQGLDGSRGGWATMDPMRELQQTIVDEFGVQAEIDPGAEVAERVQFLADYLTTTGAKGYVLGISGGLDSTLAGRLAQLAVERVRESGRETTFVAMRLPYKVQADESDAAAAIDFIAADEVITFNIAHGVDAFEAEYATAVGTPIGDFNKGNIKARMRMVAQYAVAGERGLIVIGTDHGAESVTGFFTKFGDGAADILPLYGLNKRQNRALLQHLGASEQLWAKVPTADLLDDRPLRTDEDELGLLYDDIDDYVEGREVPEAAAEKIEQTWRRTRHKRTTPVTPFNDWWRS